MAQRGKKKLTVPSCPEDKDEGHFTVQTIEEKIVRDYTGYDFDRMQELSAFEFWFLLREASIFNRMQTPEGREHLEKCWSYEQTEPDRQALRKYFGRG